MSILPLFVLNLSESVSVWPLVANQIPELMRKMKAIASIPRRELCRVARGSDTHIRAPAFNYKNDSILHIRRYPSTTQSRQAL